MRFTTESATNTVEILVGLTDMHTLTPIKVAVPGSTVDGTFVPADDPTVKAGTPLSAAGAVANTADAVGILLYDVDTSANPNGTIIQSGPIDATKAQAHSGVTYASAMKGALGNITFRTDIGTNT
jgi:hypothetical protein